MKILLADDNLVDLMICESALANLGHKVFTVQDGQELLDEFKNVDPDLILLDETMPILSGHETATILRESYDEWLPIIFISAHESPEAILNAIESGGDDYLTKPINETVLKAKIKAMERIAHMRSELIRLNDKMEEINSSLNNIADHDALTGLYNRRFMDRFFKQATDQCRRHQSNICLLMIDIDWFKEYNDRLGHAQGDECLKAVSNALNKHVKRKTDCLARYGGEEFCVILPNTSNQFALKLAEMLVDAVSGLNVRHPSSPYGMVSISIGVAGGIPNESQDYISLFELADEALYVSKDSGKNKVSINSRTFADVPKLLPNNGKPSH